MNLLITGANGFIGRALSSRLLGEPATLPAGIGPIGRLTLVDLGFEGPERPRVRRLSGSFGDPTLATAAKGEILLQAMLDDLDEQASVFFAELAAAAAPVRSTAP